MPERFARESVKIISNREVAPGHFVTTFADAEMAAASDPGQFYQVRLKGRGGPFLPRPFSIFDWHRDGAGEPAGFKILYKVVGQGTTGLSKLSPGETVAVTGPLGNTFEMPREGQELIMVAGGIGVGPFMALARKCVESGMSPERIELLYGAQRSDLLVAVDDFRELGIEVVTATDDGSGGRQATAPALLAERLDAAKGADEPAIVAAGPMGMLDALVLFCRERGITAQLSLEARMICGIAVCNSCAVRVRAPEAEDGWDYKLVCRDGPVFSSAALWVD